MSGYLFLFLLCGALVAIGFCGGVLYAMFVLAEPEDPDLALRRQVDSVFDEASERMRRISDLG